MPVDSFCTEDMELLIWGLITGGKSEILPNPVRSKVTACLPAIKFSKHSSWCQFVNIWELSQNRLSSLLHFRIPAAIVKLQAANMLDVTYNIHFPHSVNGKDEIQHNNPSHWEHIYM